MKHSGNIEIVQFFRPVVALLFHRRPYRVKDAFFLQPQYEAGLWILFRQSCGLEDDPQQRQSDTAAGPGSERSQCRMKPAEAFACIGQFPQVHFDAFRQRGNAARRCPVIKHSIRPERRQHFDQMRLAAAKEAADPNPWLLFLVQIFQVHIQDMLQTFFILAVANKGIQLVAKDSLLIVIDAGNPLVDDLPADRIHQIDLLVQHDFPPALQFLICSNHKRMVVPAVVSVQQAEIIVFVTARKKHQQTPGDFGRDLFHHILDLDQAK